MVKRKTATTRFTRSLKRIAEWCREHRHFPVAWQHEQLGLKLRGYGAYYAITGNLPLVRAFRDAVARVGRKWLNRRSQRRDRPWGRFARLLQRYPLPAMRIVRPAAVS